MKNSYTSIDEYIHSFPKSTQEKLQEIKNLIKAEVPDAEEKISYQMPAFFLHRVLVYFAAYPKHIGFYPTASGIATFQKELSGYKHAKGSVQFPIDQSLPLDLIRKIVQFRVQEDKKGLLP